MKKQKGVTMVGMMIGITILSVAMAAQVRLLGNTVRREADLRNLIIATNLAREGVEIGFSWRISDGWGVLKTMKNTNLCADIDETAVLKISQHTGNCLSEKLNPVSYPGYPFFKAFLYGQADETFNVPQFWRTIRIEDCPDDPTNDICLILKSKVGWESNKNVEISKKIYNWYIP